MEEMLEDTMEGLEDDDMEDEAEEEVDKVLYELTAGNLNCHSDISLNFNLTTVPELHELPHEKTNVLHMRKQRRRSA